MRDERDLHVLRVILQKLGELPVQLYQDPQIVGTQQVLVEFLIILKQQLQDVKMLGLVLKLQTVYLLLDQ